MYLNTARSLFTWPIRLMNIKSGIVSLSRVVSLLSHSLSFSLSLPLFAISRLRPPQLFFMYISLCVYNIFTLKGCSVIPQVALWLTIRICHMGVYGSFVIYFFSTLKTTATFQIFFFKKR